MIGPSRIPGGAGLRRVFGRLFGPTVPPRNPKPEAINERLAVIARAADDEMAEKPELGFTNVPPITRAAIARRLALARHRVETGRLHEGYPVAGVQ